LGIERILVVSLGSAGTRHLRVIRSAAPHAKIMVFRHGPVTGHSEFADFTTSFLDDVQSFQPGLAVLASPASLHAEMARRLIAIGCDLLIEKPLASKLEDGRIIFAAAQTTGSTVQVGYNLRYLPSLRFFRDQIHQGCIGRVFSIRCEVGQSLESWRAGVDYRQGVSARRAWGGGVLLELSHELDYLAWIFGRIDWVGAWLGTQSDLEIDVEDTAHLVLGFRSGEALPPVASVSLDFIRHDITRRCIVIGEKGSLNWDAVKGTVEAFLKGDTEWQVLHQSNPEQDFSYTAQWQGFVGAVARPNGRPDPVAADLEQALHVLEVVEAARNSCDQNGIRMRLPVRERHGQ
jgi:predicted dehydrogenase